MKISARRAPSSKESDSSCTSRHTPHARAPARDAGARDHGADGDGMCASRSRRGVHPRSIRSRVEDRRRRARHGGTRSPTGPRAWRVRRLHHHLRRERTGQSLGDVRARRAHQPRSSPPREPAVSGRRATPPSIRTAAPVPRRRLRRSVVHGDRRRRRRCLRRRRAKTRRHLRRGRRRPARRRGNPTARLSNLERTRRVRAWGSNGRRRGGRAQTSTRDQPRTRQRERRSRYVAVPRQVRPRVRGHLPDAMMAGLGGGAGGWRSRVKRR